MRRNRYIAAAAALTAAISLVLGGCGGGGASGSSDAAGGEGTSQSVQNTTYGEGQFDNTKLTVEIFDRSNAPSGSTVTDNRWTKYAQEQMAKVGIDLEFVAVPRAEEVQKLQTMMAAGTAPDIIITYNRGLAEDFYQKGGTYDLSAYVDGEEQAKNLKAYIGEDVLEVGRNTAGELWGIPARRATATKDSIYIRKDWLDKLGMDVPTTPDELYEVLVAFKERNPEGRTDVIPFFSYLFKDANCGSLSAAFMTSVLDQDTFNVQYPNTVYADEGYGEYLRFLNKLYNEGLTDPEYYTENDLTARLSEYVVNGQVGCFDINVNGNVDNLRGGLLQNLKANNPEADIIAIEPLKNIHDGNVYNIMYPQNGAYLLVPKTCKNPAAAVAYMDWLATKEGGFTLYHGFEGEHHTMEDGVPVVIDADFNAIDKDWLRHDIFLVGNQGYFFNEEDFIKSASKEVAGYEDYVTDNYEKAGAGTRVYQPAYNSPTQSTNVSDIQLAVDEYLVKCITCKPEEFDTMLETYRTKLGEAGLEKVIEEREAYYSGQSAS